MMTKTVEKMRTGLNGTGVSAMIRFCGFAMLCLLPLATFAQQQAFNIDALSAWGYTPLYRATDDGELEDVRILLEHGADPNFQIPATASARTRGGDSMTGRTPLYQAVVTKKKPWNRKEIVQLLLKYGADPTIKSAAGDTALSVVAGNRMPLPGGPSPRSYKNPELHALMLSYMDGTGTGVDGSQRRACLLPTDTRFSDLAARHLGDRARWPEIMEANGMTPGQEVKRGDCFRLP